MSMIVANLDTEPIGAQIDIILPPGDNVTLYPFLLLAPLPSLEAACTSTQRTPRKKPTIDPKKFSHTLDVDLFA